MKPNKSEYVPIEGDIIEALAELEHEQWSQWSDNLWSELRDIRRDLDEALDEKTAIAKIDNRYRRWKANWIPYKDLPEKVKEQDRIWAKKVLARVDAEYVPKQRIRNRINYWITIKNNKEATITDINVARCVIEELEGLLK